MATEWFWIVPQSEVNDASRPSNAVLFPVDDTSALFNTINGDNAFPYKGGNYVRYQGPFTSQSAAQAANPGGGNPTAAGLRQGLTNPTNPLTGGNPNLGGALATALTSGNPLAGLFQAHIWLRVGEFALGAIMICAGLAKLAESSKTAQTIVSNTPVGKVAKLAGAIK